MHQAFDAAQFFAQAAAGMQRREILFAEAAAFVNGDGQRIAHGQGRCRARRGARLSEQASSFTAISNTTLLATASEERGFAVMVIRRMPNRLMVSRSSKEFFGLSAVGNRDEHIVAHQHPQIAVQSLRQREEKATEFPCLQMWRKFCDRSGQTCPSR